VKVNARPEREEKWVGKRYVACVDCKHRSREWFLVGGNPFIKCRKDRKFHHPEDTCENGEFRD
jgi:hypothetical protein